MSSLKECVFGDPRETKHKCNCGERWMWSYAGHIGYIEYDRLIQNLLHFVDSCDCMNLKAKTKTKNKL